MNPVHILFVEDNEGDILLTCDAFEASKFFSKLSIVRDGKEAIDFLSKQGNYPNAEEPNLLLLDINLPRKNGHEVLQFVKENSNLMHIPVIMLSSSASEDDINLSYGHHANCYITKPIDAEKYMNVVDKIQDFWFACASRMK